MKTLKINVWHKKLRCLYCGKPFQGKLKVKIIEKTVNGKRGCALAHIGCNENHQDSI